jgi:transcriptional regulator with XRE-family HTH domain
MEKMDLLELNLTAAERAEIDRLRSQINVARAALRYRLDNGLTQAELAALAQTTQARVSEVEAMKGDPKLSTLARIALALGCMIDMVPVPAAPATQSAGGFSAVASQDVTVRAGSARSALWREGTRVADPLSQGQ